MPEMKIVEGIKELKLIEKKILKNNQQITEYCSKLSNEKPTFASDEEQKKQVSSLIQANEDLVKRYTELSSRINYTNLMTIVDVNSKKYSIHELLLYKRKLCTLMESTYNSLNDRTAQNSLRSRAMAPDVQVERLWDENFKNEMRAKWQDLLNTVDSRLEVVNATLPLLEVGQ